jgi:hypothetical protein
VCGITSKRPDGKKRKKNINKEIRASKQIERAFL